MFRLNPRGYQPAPPRTLPDVRMFDEIGAAMWREWPTPLAPYVHQLGATERATVRISPPPLEIVPVGLGLGSEVCFRLGLMGQAGVLPGHSAFHVAQHFQLALFSSHPGTLKYAKRGWEAIASVAELGLVDVTIDATPTADDPRHFRRLALVDRLLELHACDSRTDPL